MKQEEKWVEQSLDNMSPMVRQKAEAWLKAEIATQDAKKAFQDTASAAARKAKLIGQDQHLVYSKKWDKISYLVKDAGSFKSGVGPKF